MNRQRVAILLEELHEELATANSVDTVLAAQLRDAVDDIQATLAENEPTDTVPLVQRLRESVYHLPENHPALKSMIGRVADALSQIGI